MKKPAAAEGVNKTGSDALCLIEVCREVPKVFLEKLAASSFQCCRAQSRTRLISAAAGTPPTKRRFVHHRNLFHFCSLRQQNLHIIQ